MKLKERLRIAWQVLAKGTCDELQEAQELKRLNNPHSECFIPGLGERRVKTYRFIYDTRYESEKLNLCAAERLAFKKIAEQIICDRAYRTSGIDRLDYSAPIFREYRLDVLLPGDYRFCM